MRKILGLIAALMMLGAPAQAQSPPTPAFYYGFVPTAAQWNSFFAAKQDVLGASLSCALMPVLTGDVTTPGGSCATTLRNIPNDTPAAGDIIFAAIGTPTPPSAGLAKVYLDAGTGRLTAQNNGGSISITILPSAATPHFFGTGIGAAGNLLTAQPAISDLANVAGVRLIGNPTGSPAAPSEIPVAATLGFSAGSLTTAPFTGDVTTPTGSFVTTVVKVNGVSYPASPSTNTVPVVTGSNTVTYQTVPNAALANSSVTYGTTTVALGASSTSIAGLTALSLTSAGTATIDWNADTYIGRNAAATFRHGQADAAAPVAQTITTQSVVAGTSNTAGANLTIAGSKGTGTGAGGSIIFQTAPAGSTGTSQNALATVLTVGPAGTVSVGAQVANGSTFSVSSNTATWSGAIAGANNQLQLIAADGNEAAASLDSFGNLSQFALRRANGTAAGATAVAANDIIGGLFGYAWHTSGGNGYSVGSAVELVSNEAQTSSAGGQRISFFATANGTTSFLEKMRLNASGGLSIGNANIGTDPGSGGLFASTSSTGTVLALNATAVITQNSSQVDASAINGNPLLHIINASGTAHTVMLDAFGSLPLVAFRRTNGTPSARTALVSNDIIVTYGGWGYDGAGYVETTALVAAASENWSNPTSHGTRMDLYTTANGGSASIQANLRVQPSGGVSVGNANIGTDGGAGVLVASALQCATPTTKTTNYTATAQDCSLIFNGIGSITLTLVAAAAANAGKLLYVKTIAAQTVVSASSNVVPLAGGSAGTAILAATAGKWAVLQSDGTNWNIIQSN